MGEAQGLEEARYNAETRAWMYGVTVAVADIAFAFETDVEAAVAHPEEE